MANPGSLSQECEHVVPNGEDHLSQRPQPLRVAGRRLATGLGVAAAGSLVVPTGVAYAEPSQEEVEERIEELTDEVGNLVQEYNEAEEDYDAAETRLEKLEEQIGDEEDRYDDLRGKVVEFANAAYQGVDLDSTSTILSVESPEDLANHAADMEHLSDSRQAELAEFAGSAERLFDLRAEAEQALDDAEDRRDELDDMRSEVEDALAEQEGILAEMDTSSVDGDSSGTSANPGSASGGAAAAMDFALSQVGLPYIWGGTGPDGYDCSGLMQAAYSAAGVSIGRTTYDQYALPNAVSRDQVQPGDIMFFSGLGHNGMYIGNGQMVHAPRTGKNLEVVNLADYWDSQFEGARRP